MSGKKNIFAISGSTRKGSSNETILQYIAEAFRDEFSLEIYEGIDHLPHFNPDLDRDNPPAEVVQFRERIAAADGVIICTPEYVFSLPGSLKNAIEWCVSTTVFSHKPVSIIVASASGEKAFESLELVMKTIETKIVDGAKLLIRGAKGKIGKDGTIDEGTARQIKHLGQSLLECINNAH